MKLVKNIFDHLVHLTQLYDKAPHGPEVIAPTFPTIQSHAFLSPWNYFLPGVILWDPLTQFPQYFSAGLLCPHESHRTKAEALHPKKWKKGDSEKDAPSRLYGKDGTVLLVSRVYVCCQGHEVIGHDTRILEKIPDSKVPFYLSHRSGITVNLAHEVNSLASTGLTFSEIERHVAQRYYNRYWLCKEQYNDNLRQHKEKASASSYTSTVFPNHTTIDLPSDDIIISCFLIIFKENEIFYTQRMSELSALYISADHTFKVAANIGVNLPDHKWVTQYDSLFCVLNEKGQVVAWQLTKGTSFTHVEIVLDRLKLKYYVKHVHFR